MRLLILVTGLAACDASEALVGINEVAANEPAERGADWVELYNAGDAVQSLDGWSLVAEEVRFDFPAGMEVPSNGLVMVWFGPEAPTDGLSTELPLPKQPFDLEFYDPSDALRQVVMVPITEVGASYALVPNEAANWQIIDEPSPNAPNDR